MSAAADSPFLRVTYSIQSTLQPFLAQYGRNPSFSQHAPSFDTSAAHSPLQPSLSEIPNRLALLGLPQEDTEAIASVLSTESSKYHALVESSRRRLLEDLSILTVSSNPSELPSLVDAACRAFLDSVVNTGVEQAQKQFESISLQPDEGSEGEDSTDFAEDSASECDGGDHDLEDDQEVVEEDENTPMKPGEEVPPLDTKFLPIFEALHERGKVLTKPEKTYLVNMTGMTYRQITIWFQNRRRGELKEDANVRASSSHAASVHSLDSSDASEDELDFEQRLNSATDTTFDIRSWRLTSALATKDGHGSSLPPSPIKFSFGASVADPDSDTESTDLSDDEGEWAAFGCRVPSLVGSVTTLDSVTNASMQSSQATSRSLVEPVIASETLPSSGLATLPRPVKALPLSRRGSPPAPLQPAQPQAPKFNFSFTGATPTPTQQQFSTPSAPTPTMPPQFVTSNERGLAVEMDITPPSSTSTLQAASPAAPFTTARFTTPPAPSSISPASPPASAGSRQNSSSPTPASTSPRPAVKPLPRRTGCAPRPRPPPRASAASTVAPASTARPSIVLPPASNPSLAATTLGALLRPSLPTPAIPADMQDRLSAMAGRMGVGATGRSGSVSAQPPSGYSSGALPSRSGPFSFGATALPKISPPPGLALASVSDRQAPTPTGGSPMSS
ncbi:hypothetical protein FRC12_013434 [Ceratobasidium sp. 428]|nr:hypothetical protein FRC12_013434 [Ceratobasidium sp. 428]